MASASHLPPFGLKSSISYPASVSMKYGCASSLHQKPTGHPVVDDTAGFARTIATRLRFDGLVTLGSLRLMTGLLSFAKRVRSWAGEVELASTPLPGL